MSKSNVEGNIPKELHEIATRAVYCTVHEQYHKGRVELRRVTRVVGSMLEAGNLGWRVVGITSEALKMFVKSDFKERPKGVQRAHFYNRIDTMKKIIENPTPYSIADLWDTWRERDKTVLCYKGENSKINTIEYINIDNDMGEYFTNAYIGYSYSWKREGEMLRNLRSDNECDFPSL